MSLCSPGLRYTYRVGAGHTLFQTLFELSFSWVPRPLMLAPNGDLRVSAALLCCRMNHRGPFKISVISTYMGCPRSKQPTVSTPRAFDDATSAEALGAIAAKAAVYRVFFLNFDGQTRNSRFVDKLSCARQRAGARLIKILEENNVYDENSLDCCCTGGVRQFAGCSADQHNADYAFHTSRQRQFGQPWQRSGWRRRRYRVG